MALSFFEEKREIFNLNFDGVISFYKMTECLLYEQCWGKLLLKAMHYNIALLPKKVTNYIT